MHVTVEILNLPEAQRAWDRARAEVGEGCYLAVRNGAAEAVQEALHKRHWKDRTGESRKLVRGYVTAHNDAGAVGVFEAAFKHASYLDSGTVAHDIVPRSAAGKPRAKHASGGPDVGTHRVALRWYDGGGNPVFARRVHVKGIRGDGFFGAGVQKCERVMQREVELSVPRAQKILDS